jgi:hypothetical protein
LTAHLGEYHLSWLLRGAAPRSQVTARQETDGGSLEFVVFAEFPQTGKAAFGEFCLGKLMLNYSVTPAFLALAYINYVQAPPMCTVPGDWGFLSSMWLMYLLMGLAHCPPWLALAKERLFSRA